jgi:hypothetical protein
VAKVKKVAAMKLAAHDRRNGARLRSTGTAYFQEPIDPAAESWVGNPLLAGDKRVKLTPAN